MKRARTMRWAAGALAALLALSPVPCAAIDWLVLVVDRSNSIDDRELALQRAAYIRLLSDATVISALGDAQVAIVEFDTRAEIVVDWTDPQSAAPRSSASAARLDRSGSWISNQSMPMRPG